MKSSITLKEIAYIHDLSVSTVSKALNDSAEISTRTKNKIKETAKAYNYRPNSIARNLKCNRSYTIGVIVPELTTPSFQQLMEGIMDRSIKSEYKIMMYPSKGSCRKEEFLTRMLTDGSIDGLMLCMADETIRKERYQYLNELLNTNFPVVLLNNPVDALICDQVFIDYENCGFMAAQKLIKKGKKHLLLLTEDRLSGTAWQNGFRKAIVDRGSSMEDHHIETVGKEEDIAKKAKMLLTQYPEIDGIILQNEKFGLPVEQVIHRSAKKNMAVINYVKDRGTLPVRVRHGVSYMTSDYLKLGEEATKAILRKIEKNKKEIVQKPMYAFFVDGNPKGTETTAFMGKDGGMPHFKYSDGVPVIGTL